MRPPLRLGLELPPLSLGADTTSADRAEALGALRALAARAESLGFTTIWLAEPPIIDLATDEVYAEGCTLAASMAPAVGVAHLGVMVGERDHRHPSIAARDVTSLDHVTGGRSALMLCYPGRSVETSAICRGLFTQDETTVEGTRFHTSGAVNRPAPVQAGGPPLVVKVAGPDEVDGSLVGQVDGVCSDGTVDDLHAVGVAVRAAVNARTGAAGPLNGPALMWIGCPLDAGGAPSTSTSVTGLLDDLREAGVDGLICRLPSRSDPLSAAVVEELADAVGDWGRR